MFDQTLAEQLYHDKGVWSVTDFLFIIDMINMLKLGYLPGRCEWIYPPGAAIAAVAW